MARKRGKVSTVSIVSPDISDPGKVFLAKPVQLDEKTFEVEAAPPTLNENGLPLLDLSQMTIGVALLNPDGSDPFLEDGSNFDTIAQQIIVIPAAVGDGPTKSKFNFMPDAAGTLVGRTHVIAAYAEGTETE